MGSDQDVRVISRRWWGIGAGLTAVGLVFVYSRTTTDELREVVGEEQSRPPGWGELHDALKENFSYLSIADEQIAAYVEDYRKRFGDPRKKSKKKKKTTIRGQFYTTFLLSSDFFRNGEDLGKPVKYVALYDPSRVPCSHPFARFV